MKNILISILVFYLISFASSHPDPGVQKREALACTPPKEYGENQSFVYPFPVSWHVHITYMTTYEKQTNEAIAFRERTREVFKDYLGEDCLHGWDEGKLCMIIDHDLHTTIGPFPIGEWSMWIPNSHLNLLIAYFMQNRGEFSVIFHPNTGCENEDHTIWAIWIGDKWNLDTHFFTPNTKTNEFNNHAGDEKNPTCLKEDWKCSHISYDGPALACCEGLTCNCQIQGKDGCWCKEIDAGKSFLKYLFNQQ